MWQYYTECSILLCVHLHSIKQCGLPPSVGEYCSSQAVSLVLVSVRHVMEQINAYNYIG